MNTRELLEARKVKIRGDFDANIKEIAKLTDENFHSEAILAGARLVQDAKLVGIAEAIVKIRDLEGHMPSELTDYRSSIRQRVMEAAKRKFTPEQVDQLNGAY